MQFCLQRDGPLKDKIARMAGTTNMRKPPFASAETLFRFVFHRNFFPLSLSYFSHSQCWRGKSATIMARLNIASLKHDEL